MGTLQTSPMRAFNDSTTAWRTELIPRIGHATASKEAVNNPLPAQTETGAGKAESHRGLAVGRSLKCPEDRLPKPPMVAKQAPWKQNPLYDRLKNPLSLWKATKASGEDGTAWSSFWDTSTTRLALTPSWPSNNPLEWSLSDANWMQCLRCRRLFSSNSGYENEIREFRAVGVGRTSAGGLAPTPRDNDPRPTRARQPLGTKQLPAAQRNFAATCNQGKKPATPIQSARTLL